MMWQLRCVLLVVVGLTLSACRSDPPGAPKYQVSGTVTQDGKPLHEGLICFKTIQTGATESFDIKNGEFQGQAESGERRVEVYVFRVTVQDLNGMKGEIQENLIPAQYNAQSTLTAKVTPAGPNQFTFELASK